MPLIYPSSHLLFPFGNHKFVFCESSSILYIDLFIYFFHIKVISHRASLVAQLVKSPPAMQETQVQLLGREDPLEKGQATHSSILGFPLWLSW